MKRADISRHFDKIACEYDHTIPSHIRDHYLQKRLELVKHLAGKGSRVFEIGCGTGLLANGLAADGYHALGLDASWRMLKVAQANCQGTFVAGESASLPFRADVFDLTLCVATLHHIADPTVIRDSILEMARVTQPNGHVVIIDHNPLNPYWPIIMKRVPQDCGAERLIPLSEIVHYVRLARSKIVNCHRSGFTPDFVPAALLPFWAIVEKSVERIPGLKNLCAHNVIIFQKTA
jgi:SAM-dependent methyltransferase